MYLLRGVWQALNCLFTHATFCVIAKGASPGQTKNEGRGKMAYFCNCGSNNFDTVIDRRVHAARRFYHATLCKRGLCCHAVSICSSVCLSVCPSVCHVCGSCQNHKDILEFFSPSGSHTFLVRQNVLQYLNNFTKQHRTVCQR